MKYKGRKQSRNVEDRRGAPRQRSRRSGGGRGKIGLGIGGIVIVLVVILLGGDPSQILGLVDTGGGGHTQTHAPASGTTETGNKKKDELADFVAVVLQDTEDAWDQIFHEQVNGDYRKPTLVLFEDQVRSACGHASAATGPFYCPGDQKLYLDLDFADELKNDFGAPGDFALAYVVAHEVGHHIQYLLGTMKEVQSQRRYLSEAEYNDLSVRLELQADFYAGVWAHYAQNMKNILDPGDTKEALRAAASVGDDRIQRKARGYVVPESFTHGSSAQRMRWYKKGFETGDLSQGDTFGARSL